MRRPESLDQSRSEDPHPSLRDTFSHEDAGEGLFCHDDIDEGPINTSSA
jgi:hypothetical protein